MNLSRLILAALALPVLATMAAAQTVTVTSCGGTFSYDAAPQRAVTLNQQATEIMLALGLDAHMAGTAYLDDEILPRWQTGYAAVPVLATRYPAREVVITADPDFLFAGFSSAFSAENLGPEADWNALGIGTYLVSASCDATHPKTDPLTAAPLLTDIEQIGAIFRIPDRAAALIDQTRTRLDASADRNAGAGRSVFVFDSGDQTPYSVGCCGSANLLVETAGLSNITADVPGRWVDVSWERVVQGNPDIIVLIDAGWSSAAEKRDYLESDPVLATLDAVRNARYVTLPFSQTVLGMQFVDGLDNLSDQLDALN